jgi:hypothetical protein
LHTRFGCALLQFLEDFMLIENRYFPVKFEDLGIGDFFFHPLSGGHTPSIKVKRADDQAAAIDLDAEQANGARVPSLVSYGEFEGLTVLGVREAFVRPTPGLPNAIIGSSGAGSPSTGALVMSTSETLFRVKGPSLHTLVFNAETGVQSTAPDSAELVWWSKWQVCIRDADVVTVLFERDT